MIATAPIGLEQRAISPARAQGNPPKQEPARFQEGTKNLLADEEYVDSAEVEDIEER